MRLKLIPGIVLTIIILCIVPVTTLAAEFQPLTLTLNSSESQFVTISAISDSSVSAEFLLQGLAAKDKTARIIGGSVLIGSGAIFMLIGTGFDDASSPFFYTLGGTTAIMGAITLSIPSLSEVYYLKIQEISNPDEREMAAASYLLTLSSQAKTSRLINGITSAVLAVYFSGYSNYNYSDDYYDFFDYDQYMAITFAVQAIYSFLIKSPAELAWERYEKSRGSLGNVRTAFQLGVNPNNGALSVGYKLSL